MTKRIVGISGTLHSPSRTGRLLDTLLAAVTERTGATAQVVELLQHGHALIDALGAPPAPDLERDYEAVRSADLLIVSTPVYKGSYTGLLKLFLDPIAQDALAGKPVLISAVGGSDQHSLVLDHELRPLFAFFRAVVLPIGVYARNADLADPEPTPALAALIADAADAAGRSL